MYSRKITEEREAEQRATKKVRVVRMSPFFNSFLQPGKIQFDLLSTQSGITPEVDFHSSTRSVYTSTVTRSRSVPLQKLPIVPTHCNSAGIKEKFHGS